MMEPDGQGKQPSWPGDGAIERSGHGEQVAPMAEDVLEVQNVLMGHWTHDIDTDPLLLLLLASMDLVVVMDPKGHAVHTACPATEMEPDGQDTQVLFWD